MNTFKILSISLLSLALLTACDSGKTTQPAPPTPTPTPTPTPKATPTPKPGATKKVAKVLKAGGVQFEVPVNWKTAQEGDKLMAMASSDDSVGLLIWVPEAATFEAASEAIDAELAKHIKEAKQVGEPKMGELNGLKLLSVEGTGKSEGKDVVWEVSLVLAKTPVFLLFLGEKAAVTKHAMTLTALAKSLKKAS